MEMQLPISKNIKTPIIKKKGTLKTHNSEKGKSSRLGILTFEKLIKREPIFG